MTGREAGDGQGADRVVGCGARKRPAETRFPGREWGEHQMPAKNVEQLKTRTAALKKKLAAKGESVSVEDARTLKKKIRRVQRKRRKIQAAAARVAKGGKKAKKG